MSGAAERDQRAPARGRRAYLSSEQRRADVLAAARAEFVKSGYDGTTVREIARAADVNDAILYRYFTTKEHLFEEAVAAPLKEAITHAFAPAAGEAGIRAVSQQFFEELLEGMQEMAPLLLTVLGDAERGERFYREHFEPALDTMVERINENLDEWEHRDFDPHTAFRAAIGMCLQMALDARFGSRPARPPRELAPELLSIMWDGLRRRPEDDKRA